MSGRVGGRVSRRLVIGSVIAVTVLAVAVVVVVVVLSASDPGPASVDDAVERFDEGDAVGDEDEGGVLRPPAGVYEYAGEGSERISFPPVSQQYGEVIPGTVSHEAGGCWVFRLDYNAAHWQDWRSCPSAGRIADMGGRTHQAWDFGVTTIESLTTFTCDPPGLLFPPDEPGWTVDHECSGSSDQVDGIAKSAGPWRYVGPESLTIGRDVVDAWRFRQERTITGAQSGTETRELWFRDDGLLLRTERDVEVASPSPIGDVTYTERGSVELIRPDPQR